MAFIQLPVRDQEPFLRWATLIGQTQGSTVVPAALYSRWKGVLARLVRLQAESVYPLPEKYQAGMHEWWKRNDLEGRMAWDRLNFPLAPPIGKLLSAPVMLNKSFFADMNAFVAEKGLSPVAAAAAAGRLDMATDKRLRVFKFARTADLSPVLPTKTSTKPAPTGSNLPTIKDPLAIPFSKTPRKVFVPKPSVEDSFVGVRVGGGFTTSGDNGTSDPEIIYEYEEDEGYQYEEPRSYTGWIIGAAALGGLILLLRKR